MISILSFTSVLGYGIRNIAALYYKAIRDGGVFENGVTREDGIDAMIKAISNSARVNIRNKESGIDDESASNDPICGKGRYNKIAEEFVNILNDLNLILMFSPLY
ncbi:MAG: hypothetical protein HOI53_00690 [Francisellaceae bacterium]|nr:hypothetical protein [Francisellaceae bacterium]MBT6206516.1 hypothetical protein [Francisellaceae bacterium]MBT6539404.1 hypothetical protein [Francisellaceae bacterium]